MNKQKVLILSGLPASGKSTFAKELMKKEPNKWKRINKDLLREMLDGGVWSGKNESEIIKTRDDLLRRFLVGGYNVIIDDTNFDPKHAKSIKELARIWNDDEFIDPEDKFNIEVEEKFFNVPVWECIERDKLRGDKMVGEKVIIGMWKKYLDKPVKQEYNPELPDCIIVDVDGTLAYKCDRDIFDYSKVIDDIPNRNLIEIINRLSWSSEPYNAGFKNLDVIILSGREDSSQKETSEWLIKNNVLHSKLFMRKTGDHRDDTIIKKELYEEHIKGKYNVIGVFDDRPKVVRMWKEQGLFVMDCNRQDSRIDF